MASVITTPLSTVGESSHKQYETNRCGCVPITSYLYNKMVGCIWPGLGPPALSMELLEAQAGVLGIFVSLAPHTAPGAS